MKKWILLMILFLAQAGYAWTLKPGTYNLSGGNSFWGSSYEGEVVICPNGENYRVIWKIGTSQTQVGVGVLQGDILSVAFTDLSKPSFWGVISYRVKPFGELEGKWASYESHSQKAEYLVWKNDFIY